MAARNVSKNAKTAPAPPAGRAFAAAFLAWLVPGAGHVFLGRRGRGVAFFVIVGIALGLGWQLDGELSHRLAGHPLEVLRTLGCLGLGLPYFLLRLGLGYAGQLQAPGYEYGSAFLLTAGLMNYLLVLDAWDVARGEKT